MILTHRSGDFENGRASLSVLGFGLTEKGIELMLIYCAHFKSTEKKFHILSMNIFYSCTKNFAS